MILVLFFLSFAEESLVYFKMFLKKAGSISELYLKVQVARSVIER